MEPRPINERFAPAEGYTTHEALKAIFRHYADLGRKPRDGVERGVDRTQWAKLVSESPDLPARLATADADLVFAKVAACVEINQCVGCTRQLFTKSFLGDDTAVLARSSGEEPASPRHRAGVASMAWRTTRRFKHERAVKF